MSEDVDMKFVEDVVLELSDSKGGNVLETVAEDEELLELGTKDGTGTGVVGNNAAGSNLAFPGPGTCISGKIVLKLKLA